MSSYFLTPAEAQRYLESRINFHHIVVSKVVKYLRLSQPLDLILDVGCGTGHSTQAFAALANNIIGVDHSKAMLSLALPGENIRYEVQSAEEIDQLAIRPDMIIAGQSFHWFNRRIFLKKSQQILKEGGTLIIFTHAINHPDLSQMDKDFPQPFPVQTKFKEEAEILGFIHLDLLVTQETIRRSKQDIINHLRTLSSVEKEFQNDPKLAASKLAHYFFSLDNKAEIELTSSSQIWILKKA
jgi:SAM-dependent methyltransferase